MLARFLAWTGFAAAFVFIGGLTVFGQPGFLAMSPAELWHACPSPESCPDETARRQDAQSAQVASTRLPKASQ